MRYWFYKILTLFFICGHSLAQENIEVSISPAFGIHNFNNCSSEEGLLGSVVEYIYQDSRGYIWAATRSGVNVLDGYEIKSYSKKDGLIHQQVRGIEEDSEGLMWFATEKGVSSFDGFSFTNYNESNGLSHNQTWIVLEHENGGMLVGTTDGIDIIKNGQVEKFLDIDSLANGIRLLEYDSKGNLWVCNGKRTYKIDKDKNITDMNYNALILDMTEDRQGNIWLARESGLVKIDWNSPFSFINENQNLAGIGNRAHARGDQLYLGTSVGLFQTDLSWPLENITQIKSVRGTVYNIQEVGNRDLH